MKDCFEVLGVSKDASIEDIQRAFERKAERYKGDFYAEDPAYAKKKLKELKEAYEAAVAAVLGNAAETSTDKPDVSYDEDPEEYMRQLYHKHLTASPNRAAGLRPKRPKAFEKRDAAYKSSVLLFWVVIIVAIIAVGSFL